MLLDFDGFKFMDEAHLQTCAREGGNTIPKFFQIKLGHEKNIYILA